MSLTVTVTQEHVDRARAELTPATPRVEFCPIALAIKDVTKEPWAFAHFDQIGWGKGYRDAHWTETPEPALDFMEAFDADRDVSALLPLTFEL